MHSIAMPLVGSHLGYEQVVVHSTALDLSSVLTASRARFFGWHLCAGVVVFALLYTDCNC